MNRSIFSEVKLKREASEGKGCHSAVGRRCCAATINAEDLKNLFQASQSVARQRHPTFSINHSALRTQVLRGFASLCFTGWMFFLPGLLLVNVAAAETWQTALARMPLGTNVTSLNRSNCVDLMLTAFQSNRTVKALVFMPGATDEFYMFHRAKAKLTNDNPTLLDAVKALTSQTYIRATFHAPFLVLHTVEDHTQPVIKIKDKPTVRRLKERPFVVHADFNDRDWDFLLPILGKNLNVALSPGLYSLESWHFYRHSFAAWDLNGWEALQAVALAGKTTFTVDKDWVLFKGDIRPSPQPPKLHWTPQE